jgi:hypothetical protein
VDQKALAALSAGHLATDFANCAVPGGVGAAGAGADLVMP